MPILKQQVDSSPNLVSLFSFMKDNSSVLFSPNNTYFAQKEPIKVKIFETFKHSGQNLSNSLCQFWNDELIPLHILYPYSISWKITPLCFFSSSNIYFAQKEHIKIKTFETFKCLGQYLANSSCQIWNDKSIPLQTLRHFSLSWQITPLWLLSSYFFQLWIRGSHQNPNFETFKCSGENLPFSSCHFSSHKSVESNVR